MDNLRLDLYVVDTLMADLVGHDRSPSSFLVYLALVARRRGDGRRGLRCAPALASPRPGEVARLTPLLGGKQPVARERFLDPLADVVAHRHERQP